MIQTWEIFLYLLLGFFLEDILKGIKYVVFFLVDIVKRIILFVKNKKR